MLYSFHYSFYSIYDTKIIPLVYKNAYLLCKILKQVTNFYIWLENTVSIYHVIQN